jgi:hypothetical protein
VRTRGRIWLWLGLATLLAVGPAEAQRPPDEAILPVDAHRGPDVQALARTHAAELRALYDEVRRCAPDLDIQHHGIGFRRPRGVANSLPHLALWLRLDAAGPLAGNDLAERAGQAFRRYARRLLPRLVARGSVHGDAQVGGYALLLTWIRTARAGDTPVGETLVVFADKRAVAAFVDRSLPASDLLGQALVRAFDGETEVTLGALPLGAQEPEPAPLAC